MSEDQYARRFFELYAESLMAKMWAHHDPANAAEWNALARELADEAERWLITYDDYFSAAD